MEVRIPEDVNYIKALHRETFAEKITSGFQALSYSYHNSLWGTIIRIITKMAYLMIKYTILLVLLTALILGLIIMGITVYEVITIR